MIYDCVECLPDNVKAALDENGQKMWMDAFNKTVKKSKTRKSYRDAVFDAWQMVKNYEGCRYFSGMVSTEDLDRQNDVVEVNKAFERIAKHIERGGTMVDTHTNRTVGSFGFAIIGSMTDLTFSFIFFIIVSINCSISGCSFSLVERFFIAD